MKFDIKVQTVAPYDHQSLQADHGIKSFCTVLIKHLIDLVQMWLKYLSLAMLAYNAFSTPNLANYNPYCY